MAMIEARLKQWGNSLGIIIPSEMVKLNNLQEGESIKIDMLSQKSINGFGMFPNISSVEKEYLVHEDLS